MAQDGKSKVERGLDSAQSSIRSTARDMVFDTVDDCKGMPEKILKDKRKEFVKTFTGIVITGIAAFFGVSIFAAWSIMLVAVFIGIGLYHRKSIINSFKTYRVSKKLRSKLRRALASPEQVRALQKLDPSHPYCEKEQAQIDIETLYEIRSKSLGVDLRSIREMDRENFEDELKDLIEEENFLVTMHTLLKQGVASGYDFQGAKLVHEFLVSMEGEGSNLRLKAGIKPFEFVNYNIGDSIDENALENMTLLNQYVEGNANVNFVDIIKDEGNDISAQNLVDLTCRAVNKILVYRAVKEGTFDDLLQSNNSHPPVKVEELQKARQLVRILSKGNKHSKTKYKDLSKLLYNTEKSTLRVDQYEKLFAILDIASRGELSQDIESSENLLMGGKTGSRAFQEALNNFSYDISVGYALNIVRQCSTLTQELPTLAEPLHPARAENLPHNEDRVLDDAGYHSPTNDRTRAPIYEDDDSEIYHP